MSQRADPMEGAMTNWSSNDQDPYHGRLLLMIICREALWIIQQFVEAIKYKAICRCSNLDAETKRRKAVRSLHPIQINNSQQLTATTTNNHQQLAATNGGGIDHMVAVAVLRFLMYIYRYATQWPVFSGFSWSAFLHFFTSQPLLEKSQPPGLKSSGLCFLAFSSSASWTEGSGYCGVPEGRLVSNHGAFSMYTCTHNVHTHIRLSTYRL